MPSKPFDKYFSMASDTEGVPMFMGNEYVRCPSCDFRMPVETEYIDYKDLYENQNMLFRRYQNEVNAFFLELEKEIPEAYIYFFNKRSELYNRFEELKRGFGFEGI